jgi:hypothetical protein
MGDLSVGLDREPKDHRRRRHGRSAALSSRRKPRVGFEELFDFYGAAGFLYPAKLAALEARWPAIETTWRRLLVAEDVFALIARRASDGALANTASAFAYAGGTWQGQHLVSRVRREYTGTLAVLIRTVEWFRDHGAAHGRISFRPNNPGTNRLFGAVVERVPCRLACISVADYGLAPLEQVSLRAARRVRVTRDAAALARDFYERTLHPVEAASLRLDDPRLADVGSAYADAGLHRSRTVLVATLGGAVAGAVIVNHASEGINFSFLENAIEHLRVAPHLSPKSRRSVWMTLLHAAVETVAAQGRDYVVATTDPRDRDLAVASGIVPEDPKQYATLTASERGFTRAIGCWREYYDALLAAQASAR